MRNTKDLHVITTTLEGFISLTPSGKFNNCRIGFTLDQDTFDLFEAEYANSLVWGASKLAGKSRIGQDPQPWGEDGQIKYSYGNPDPGPEDSKKEDFLWVIGPDNKPFDLETIVRAGTKVQLAIRLKPYVFGTKCGLSLRVVAGKILEIQPFNEVPESVTAADVASIFAANPVVEAPDSDGLPF